MRDGMRQQNFVFRRQFRSWPKAGLKKKERENHHNFFFMNWAITNESDRAIYHLFRVERVFMVGQFLLRNQEKVIC